MLAPEDDKICELMYDESFTKELSNIKSHKNESNLTGNMVHYVISSRSEEVAYDMINALTKTLYDANRICSRRIEVVSNMSPSSYNTTWTLNFLENIIENNLGGTVVFDLSERFGKRITEYQKIAEYIEKLVKRYKNDCLFIFTYNMDNPGFSYSILPNLKKYCLPLMLREGTSDRKIAVRYLKALVKKSEYAAYANQVGEFMKQYMNKEFTHTDILNAYEQFEIWALNKNVFKAYDYNMDDAFLLDRDENSESAYDRLQKMIGLSAVKEEIDAVIATNCVTKERRKRQPDYKDASSMHMLFTGNPGSAKTTVAKLFSGICKEKGILKSGAFVEKGGMDLNGPFGEFVLRDSFKAAMGGVLFIDEAYELSSSSSIAILIQEMENHRDDVIVILAGYADAMNSFMRRNDGLVSRVPNKIEFPDYNADELSEIFKYMVAEKGFSITDDAMAEAHYIFDKVCHIRNFGNGRYVRNLLERSISNQSVRLMSDKDNAEMIKNRELFKLIKDDIIMPDDISIPEKQPGAAQAELDEMIGLDRVKTIIRKAIASFKLNKRMLDKGIVRDKASFHMVFTGNPGSAKTTVARLFAEIMRDENVLPTGKFVEVGRADLVGNVVGETALKVKERFRDAEGGVLFIDEAYSLCDDIKGGFGAEAINTIVQEMENQRDKMIVIFAGYPKEMKWFLETNPGLSSRIAFHVEFDDYSVDELVEITKLMLKNKHLNITEAAMDKLCGYYEVVSMLKDYGNGRFVRKMLEKAEMNLAERLLGLDESELTDELITTIDVMDISEPDITPESKKMKLGFAC